VRNTQGWTLIELVLFLCLVGIIGALFFRTTFNAQTFSHYRFNQEMIKAIHKAKSMVLYSNAHIRLAIKDDNWVFIPVNANSLTPIAPSWQVPIPVGIKINHTGEAVLGAPEGGAPIVVNSLNHQLIIDTRTIYAYQKAIH
jgi:type II secretory pathway pseudopilin PulG